MNKPTIFGIGKLGIKLAIAFLGVALTAIIVMSGLIEMSTGRDVGSLVMQQEDALSRSVAVASGALYSGTGWRQANLQPVLELVQHEGAAVQVRDVTGKVIQATRGFVGFQASSDFVRPIMMHGDAVGSVTVKFGADRGLGSVLGAYDSERLRASIGAAGIVALVALVVSLLISRQITMPLERMLAT